MFELHDVWKGQSKAAKKDDWTLAGVDLAIPAGLRIALLGSDAKKNSIALRVLSGVDSPDRGAIRRDGSVCWPLDYTQFLDMRATLSQNVNFLAQVYGVDAADMLRIATRLSGLKAVRRKPINQYLSIDRRSIALGLTLSLQFDWYFIDDRLPRSRESVAREVEAVLEDRLSNGSVIWATTKPQNLGNYCNAGLLLDRGTLTFYSDFQEAVDAFRKANEAKTDDAAKPRKAGRRGRPVKRPSEVDTENAG